MAEKYDMNKATNIMAKLFNISRADFDKYGKMQDKPTNMTTEEMGKLIQEELNKMLADSEKTSGGTKLAEASVKEQFSFLKACKAAVKSFSDKMDKLTEKFMPNGLGARSNIERS